jgi:hypothetical protein
MIDCDNGWKPKSHRYEFTNDEASYGFANFLEKESEYTNDEASYGICPFFTTFSASHW